MATRKRKPAIERGVGHSNNDLAGWSGRTSKEFKFSDEYGSYSGTEIGRGRSLQRGMDQLKRSEKKAAQKKLNAAKVEKGKK